MIELSGKRVLHIVEPWSGRAGAGLASRSGCDTLAAACALHADPHRHRVLVLGPARAERRLAALGLLTTDSICPPARIAALAWKAVLSYVNAAGPFDTVVCWGRRMGSAARGLAGGPREVYVATLSGGAGPAALQDKLPTVDRRAWREALQIGEDEPVVALLDDTACGASARRFLFVLGTVEVAGRRVVGLVPTGVAEQARSRRFRRAAGLSTRIIAADRPMQGLLPAADAGVLLGPFSAEPRAEGSSEGVARLNLRLAAAAGLPVVTAERWAVTDGLPEAARGFLARSDHSTDLGRELFDVLGDPGRRAAARASLLEAAQREGRGWLSGVRFKRIEPGWRVKR